MSWPAEHPGPWRLDYNEDMPVIIDADGGAIVNAMNGRATLLAERDTLRRLVGRLAQRIQLARLADPNPGGEEGWLLVEEAREQLDRVAWYLLAKLSPSPHPVCDPESLRHDARLAGWDLGAWLRRADTLHAAVNHSPAPPPVKRAPWIDPETGLVVARFVDAAALADAPPCHGGRVAGSPTPPRA